MDRSLLQIVAAAIGVLAIAVSAIIFWLGEKGKEREVQAELVSKVILLSPTFRTREHLRILYKDREVFNFAIVQILIRNSGAQSIRSSDIEEEIEIELEGFQEIVSSEIVEKYPKHLPIDVEPTKNGAKISKTLLNSGDRFVVEIGGILNIGDEPSVIAVNGRIAGVDEIVFIDKLIDKEVKNKMESYLILSMSIAGMIMSILLFTELKLRLARKQD